MGNYNVSASIHAQAKLCEEKDYPHFAPKNGRCWNCGKNIYEPQKIIRAQVTEREREYIYGVTVEKAGSELITGCPHCNRSYCD